MTWISELEEEFESASELPGREVIRSGACILEGKIASNGFHGGDAGHGARHYLKIENGGGTWWCVRVWVDDRRVYVMDDPKAIEILLGGDDELRAIYTVLKVFVEYLEQRFPRLKETYKEEKEELEIIKIKDE